MAALFAALGRQNPGNVGISRQARAEPSSARQSGPPDIELQAACQVSDLVSDLARQVSDLARTRREIMAPVIRDGKWEYLDDSGATQGPFTTAEMSGWFAAGYLATDRQVRKAGSTGDYVGLGNIAELAPAPVS